LLPLFVALGAGGELSTGQPLHSSFTYGILSMASYAFGC
jgi:4,5-DOPA dioxygenase extradiol